GFDTKSLLTFSVNLPPTTYPKDPDAIRFDKEFTDRLRALPGVAGVASNSVVPLTGGGASIRFVIEGQPVAKGHENECNIRDVSNNYFPVMKIPLRAGRLFDDSTDSSTVPSTSSSTKPGRSNTFTARILSASASNLPIPRKKITAKSSASWATPLTRDSTVPKSQVSSFLLPKTRILSSTTSFGPLAIRKTPWAKCVPPCMP